MDEYEFLDENNQEEPENSWEESIEEISEETIPEEEPESSEESGNQEEIQPVSSISANDLEEIFEKYSEYSVSGNDLNNDMQGIYDLLQQSDDAHTEETQELIAVCNKINQNVEMGTTSVCSLLGLLIGILLAKTFAIFMKGV